MGCYISLMVTFFGSWIYVKRTHTAPSWLMAIWINSLSVTILLFILSNPNYPWEFTLIGIIIAVPITNMHSLNLISPITALVVFGYNFSLGRMGAPYPLMVFPEGFDQTPGELVQAYVRGIVVVLAAIYCVHLQTEEFTRTILAAAAAYEMSLEVSQKVSVYDTDGARAVLAAYASRERS